MQNKLGIGITAVGAVIIVVVGIVGWAVIPKVIDNKIKEQLQLTEDSDVFETWKDIPYPIYLEFRIYHITNPDEVEAGEKAVFEERGPYVYRQTRTKEDLQHLDLRNPNNTIQYKEKKTYFFDQEKSGQNKESDLVNVINIPFIAVIHGVRAKVPDLAPTIANVILANETLVRRNVVVGELLFSGFDVKDYTDSLLGPMLPKEFSNGTFGIYKGENGTQSKVYDIYTGVDNYTQFGKIRKYNGEAYLTFWQPGTFCDEVRGSDGSLFPPFLKKDTEFYVFSSDLCRSLKFDFDSEQELKDVKLYRYKVPKQELADPRENKENQCYCLSKTLEQCPKAGAMSLEGCREGAPIMMSTPSFLDGDAGYLEKSGLPPPEREKHMTYLDIEPNSGVLFRGHKRIQVNLDIQIGYDVNAYKNLKENIVFPLLWADENAEIDEENADKIKDELLKPKKIVNITKWTLMGVGIAVVIAGAAIFVIRRRKRTTETA